MLLQYPPTPSIKLEERLVYPPKEPVHLPPFSIAGDGCGGSSGSSGHGWSYCTKDLNNNNNNDDNNNNNNKIYLDISRSGENKTKNYYSYSCNNHNHKTHSSYTTLNYSNSNTDNSNNNNSYYSSNSNVNNTKVNLDVGCIHPTPSPSHSSFRYNIPVFLPSVKEEKDQTMHHQPHTQQPLYQQHPATPSSSSSISLLSSSVLSPLNIINNDIGMASTTKETATAAVMTDLQPLPLSTSSKLVLSSPLSTVTSQPTVLKTSPASPQISSSSSSLTFSSPLSSLSTSKPSSFSETNYSTSDDKLYLVNNYPHNCISSTTDPSTVHSNKSSIAKGSLNMINVISSYNAENIKIIEEEDDVFDNDNHNDDSGNCYNLCEYVNSSCHDSDAHRPLPDIWTALGLQSPINLNNTNCNDGANASMMTSDTFEDCSDPFTFETLRDVPFSPIEDEIIQNLYEGLKSCSDEDEDGSYNMSDGGYSSDHTTIQSSPISNESSSDWSGTFENDPRLPIFKEIQQQVSSTESVKPPRKTPSPRQKRKSADSPTTHEKERKKPGRKPGQVSNVLHLWEFMRDLLHDPSISEGIIQWVSKAEGVFRVVDSSEVARLWGQKKNNKKEMTYEKLSRSLRYSRLEGYFDNLPKDKNYPKKLCFKFGPKSRHFNT